MVVGSRGQLRWHSIRRAWWRILVKLSPAAEFSRFALFSAGDQPVDGVVPPNFITREPAANHASRGEDGRTSLVLMAPAAEVMQPQPKASCQQAMF